ncbi:MAG: PIN domain-containing protein [Rudanella sp.]|nr:PIN domain-containing protein [Rudanella sp.]
MSTVDDVITFLSRVKEWTISEEIIRKTVEIRQVYRIKIPDAIIAATALIHDLILLSDNDRDFGKISRLQYVNPQKMPGTEE